jgi:hypothetical protein
VTDPSNALESFQQELLLHGTTKLKRGVHDQSLFVHFDSPNGVPRFTYVRLKDTTVTALVMFAMVEPIEGKTCFALG